jgi:dTDP-4-amino-4,6-dideoxygalactose transaminase
MVELGFNYRMSELHAALGISQLKRIDSFIEKRKNIVKYYLDKIRKLPLDLPPYSSDSAWHLFVCQTQDKKTRKKLYQFLNEKNIHAAIHYRPIYQNSYFQKLGFNDADFPNAESYYSRSISLPLHTEIKERQLYYIVEKLYEFFGVNND